MSPNQARAKGTAWETALVKYLTARGIPTHRLPLSSPSGDLQINGRKVVVEAKNHRKLDLGAWFRQAAESAKRRGVDAYAVLHKRVGFADPGESYATVPIAYLADLWLDQIELENLQARHPSNFKVDL